MLMLHRDEVAFIHRHLQHSEFINIIPDVLHSQCHVSDAMFDLLAAPGQKATSCPEQPAEQAAGEDQPTTEGKG